MKRAFVVLLVGIALLAAAEAWLRTGGASLASATVGSPPPLAIPSPDRPRAAPLLVVGSTFTAGAGLRDDERWTARLAQRVVGGDSFSEVLAVAPLAQPAVPILSHLSSFARTGTFRGTAAIVPHERGADVVVIEAGGDALGADPSPFVIEDLPAAGTGPAARPPAGGLALLRALDGWRAARDRERDELAVAQLAVADGFVAGAAERARRRLDGISEAVRTRKPTPEQSAFLRALLLELHGLARAEQREAAFDEWKRLLGTLRMQQRGVVLVRSGPPLLTMALTTLAEELRILVVQAPPFELDPRFRTGPDGHVAAAVHAQLADMVWLALSRKQMVPEAMRAPADVAATAERIDAAAHAREGIDGSLVALAHVWTGNRCEFGEAPPPQALTGVGRRGRLVPGVAAEIVLSRPPIPDELIVHATARAGALPRLALRHQLGRATLEAKALGPVPGSASRVQLEYRIAAPASRDVVAWPAYEYTLEPAGDDPAFELTDVTITPKVEVDPPR
jgi:hypothetical protein